MSSYIYILVFIEKSPKMFWRTSHYFLSLLNVLLLLYSNYLSTFNLTIEHIINYPLLFSDRVIKINIAKYKNFTNLSNFMLIISLLLHMFK